MPFFTTNDGVRLWYEDVGRRKPIVFIGGWTMSTAWWQKQIPELSKYCRVIAIDMRAYGKSDKPAYGHRITRHAMDLQNALSTLDLHDVTLIGWSMGAATILSYLNLFGKERIVKAILIDQTPKIVSDEEWKKGVAEDFTAEKALQFVAAIKANHADFLQDFIPQMFYKERTPAELRWMLREMLKTPADIAAKLMLDNCVQDWRDILPTIKIPIFIIAGKQSKWMVPGCRYMAKQIPHAKLLLFEQSAHCPFYEEPEKFNTAVRQFVD
ncbi:alpha/beta hydrolase [Candidatus Woesearchaeota archaeon]|nr:alpha/beta hydrolase [Candidatus Woesearchaeota archaeon]